MTQLGTHVAVCNFSNVIFIELLGSTVSEESVGVVCVARPVEVLQQQGDASGVSSGQTGARWEVASLHGCRSVREGRHRSGACKCAVPRTGTRRTTVGVVLQSVDLTVVWSAARQGAHRSRSRCPLCPHAAAAGQRSRRLMQASSPAKMQRCPLFALTFILESANIQLSPNVSSSLMPAWPALAMSLSNATKAASL